MVGTCRHSAALHLFREVVRLVATVALVGALPAGLVACAGFPRVPFRRVYEACAGYMIFTFSALYCVLNELEAYPPWVGGLAIAVVPLAAGTLLRANGHRPPREPAAPRRR